MFKDYTILQMHKAHGKGLITPGVNNCYCNLEGLESPMIYTKIQPQSFLGSGDEYVLTIYVHGGCLIQ